ncbi:MAG: hypothetical protein ABI775_08740 [Pseudonocardiales bacterium]
MTPILTVAGVQHDHDLGLAHDLSTLVERRRALGLLAGFGLVLLVGRTSSTKTKGSEADDHQREPGLRSAGWGGGVSVALRRRGAHSMYDGAAVRRTTCAVCRRPTTVVLVTFQSVFRGGYASQLATVTGDVTSGLTIALLMAASALRPPRIPGG